MKIAVLGSVSEDLIIKTDNFVGANEECFLSSHITTTGGGGANVACMMSSLFNIKAYILSCVGSDVVGKKLLSELKDKNVLCDYVKTIPNEESTKHVICLDANENRITYVSSGAMSKFEINLFPEKLFEYFDYIYLAPTKPETAISLIERIKNSDIQLFFNPGSAFFKNHELLISVLQHTDTLIINEYESIKYSNTSNTKDAAHFFLGIGVNHIVITLGQKGSMVSDRNGHLYVPGFDVKVNSTIGCGDAFSAGYVGSMITGSPIKDAVVFANATGAFVAQEKLMRENIPSRVDVEKIIEKKIET